MKQSIGRHFLLRYQDVDAAFAKAAIDAAEHMLERLSEDFGIPAEQELFELLICPDTASFLTATGKDEQTYQPWMIGNANYEERRLCILSPSCADQPEEEMLGVVRHEAAHIAFGNISGKSPEEISPLIAEGGAVFLAGQIDGASLKKNGRPDAFGLQDEEYFFANDGYNYSGAYMGHLIETYGAQAYIRLYTEAEALEALTGWPLR